MTGKRTGLAITVVVAAAVVLMLTTHANLRSAPDSLPGSLNVDGASVNRTQFLDRHGAPLTVTYANRWNTHDHVPLHEIPAFLQQAFVVAEDQRFYRHGGPDWRARLHAGWQNLQSRRLVRGASTITEQVVRMLYPRPRTFWSRWLEGFEAARLERRFSKAAILEFYLNQVPYAAQRRGVAQAARHYFDRGLDTLTDKEMLVLAVMVRAPARLDPLRDAAAVEASVRRLANRMLADSMLGTIRHQRVLDARLRVAAGSQLPVQAAHFVRYVGKRASGSANQLVTSLDAGLQGRVQVMLDNRVRDLAARGVRNGAVLVVDHQTDEILAWVNAGQSSHMVGSDIDTVTAPRQPGSALKPFVYALALEQGWSAATLIDDTPLTQLVGQGLHRYHNYSRRHYGRVRLRDALGNSLNIPAVRAAHFVGTPRLLARLAALGIEGLRQHPDFYGDGIALGNGEVSLLELVQAYAALARRGVYRSLRTHSPAGAGDPPRSVFSAEVSSLMADILSDPGARSLEFGSGGLLNLPVQTAVKTGTSSDFRDAWAVGFNYRYTVGIWMGNLDYSATDGLTGAQGPALVLRSVFAELNRGAHTRPLYLSPRLRRLKICRDTGLPADRDCVSRTELFVAGTEPARPPQTTTSSEAIRLRQPADGLQLALDPRIPATRQAFALTLPKGLATEKVEWWVDKQLAGTTGVGERRYLWPLSRGSHHARARVWLRDAAGAIDTPAVAFQVK